MAITAIGNVYYADDPLKQIFRRVTQFDTDPDDVLDDPTYITDGCDPLRLAVMVKCAPDSPDADAPMTGCAFQSPPNGD